MLRLLFLALSISFTSSFQNYFTFENQIILEKTVKIEHAPDLLHIKGCDSVQDLSCLGKHCENTFSFNLLDNPSQWNLHGDYYTPTQFIPACNPIMQEKLRTEEAWGYAPTNPDGKHPPILEKIIQDDGIPTYSKYQIHRVVVEPGQSFSITLSTTEKLFNPQYTLLNVFKTQDCPTCSECKQCCEHLNPLYNYRLGSTLEERPGVFMKEMLGDYYHTYANYEDFPYDYYFTYGKWDLNPPTKLSRGNSNNVEFVWCKYSPHILVQQEETFNPPSS